MKRIALYGGTFDPVHLGHLAVAHGLSKIFALDEVLFIPAYVAPHKRKEGVTPALHRYAMLALVTQHEERFRISTIELDAPEKPYTFETLQRMREELGIAGDDAPRIADLFHQKYRGSRYSFGYPACPNLEDQTKIFQLLDPEKAIGVRLTSGYQLEPEQSTSALVVHHPAAKYFVV